MDFEIIPFERVGPILFGMSRDSVRALFSVAPHENHHPMAPVPSDEWADLGIRVDYSPAKCCEAVLMVSPTARALFNGRSLLEEPHRDLSTWIQGLDSGSHYPDPGELSLVANTYGFMLGAPRDDEPPESRRAMAVLAWEAGYWDDGGSK